MAKRTASNARPTNLQALDAFVSRKAKFDEMLATLAALSEDHFNVLPDDVSWADVGSLNELCRRMKSALNFANGNDE